MYYLYMLTILTLLISVFKNVEKTSKAIKIALKRFINILPAFLSMLILVSIILFLVPDKVILTYLGKNNKFIGIIFTYIGASAICRVPMTIFEASFMGIKFSLIRLLVSLPLVIATSMLLGNYLTRRKYKIFPGE